MTTVTLSEHTRIKGHKCILPHINTCYLKGNRYLSNFLDWPTFCIWCTFTLDLEQTFITVSKGYTILNNKGPQELWLRFMITAAHPTALVRERPGHWWTSSDFIAFSMNVIHSPCICTRNSVLMRLDASESLSPLALHSESTSSMKIMDGLFSLAKLNRFFTSLKSSLYIHVIC